MALELKKRPSKKADVDDAEKVSKKHAAVADKPFVPLMPRVNLLSSDVLDVVEQQKLKRLFVGLGVATVALVVAAFLAQQGLITVAQNKLDAEQAKSAELATQQAALAPVRTFYSQIDANKATIQTTMAKEVLTSDVISELNRAAPAGMTLSNIGVSLDSGGGTAIAADPTAVSGSCPSQDPYNTGGLSAGCVTVDGTATSRDVLGEWLDAIGESDLFTVAFIPSTSAGEEGVSFSATVGLSDSVYKNRYADPEFLKGGSN